MVCVTIFFIILACVESFQIYRTPESKILFNRDHGRRMSAKVAPMPSDLTVRSFTIASAIPFATPAIAGLFAGMFNKEVLNYASSCINKRSNDVVKIVPYILLWGGLLVSQYSIWYKAGRYTNTLSAQSLAIYQFMSIMTAIMTLNSLPSGITKSYLFTFLQRINKNMTNFIGSSAKTVVTATTAAIILTTGNIIKYNLS
jgi:hypothetical protein